MNKAVYITIGAIVAGVVIFALVAGRSLNLLENAEDNPAENPVPINPSALGLSIGNVSVQKIDDKTANVQVTMNVHNPAKQSIGLEILHYSVYVNDARMTSGDIGENLGGAMASQAGIFPVAGNSTLVLKDAKVSERNSSNGKMWDDMVAGKASYVIKGIYSYRGSTGLSTIRAERDFELRYPGSSSSYISTSTSPFANARLIQTIDLSNVGGRIDHMDVDSNGQRLFVAELGNNSVDVIDLNTGKRIHSITGLHEPQGILFIPEYKRIFVANGGDGTVGIYDSNSFNLVDSVKFSDDADNIRYDANAKLVYVGYGDGAIGIINATDAKIVGDIKLPGHPESFQLEKLGSRIFVNVPTDNSIVVIDREKQSVMTKWSLVGVQRNFPMELDEQDHRLFVGTREPAEVLVFDTESGKVVASLDISKDPDDIFYNAKNKRIYVSCGEGFINVIKQRDVDHYELTEKIPTAAGARTSLLVPELNQFYIAVPQYGNQEAEIRVYEVQQ